MARSSSVRRWLEDLRYETESYDPQLQLHQQQDTASTVTWRYARVTWSPETATRITSQPEEVSESSLVVMPSNRMEAIANNVREVIIPTENRENIAEDQVQETNSQELEGIRNRLATVSVPPNTVSNNVRRFQNTVFLSPQQLQQNNNDELILRRPQHLQTSSLLLQRPHSHQHPKQSSYLHREQNPALPSVIREGPINRVKLMTSGAIKSPKHWKTGMHALLTDRALFFFDDEDALLSMKSGSTSSGVSSKDRVVDLRDGARIVQDTDRSHSTKRNVLAICSRDGQIAALMQNDEQQLSDSWYRDVANIIAKHVKDADTPTGGGVTNTKTVLNWFFRKRPNKETLVNQGIYKNEPIFGNTLERLYEASDRKKMVPAFVLRCTEILENPPHVLSIGLYRTSGNLSHIQKLRLRVDQEDAEALEDLTVSSDSDVLAGALKLFFRELQVPLVPYQIYLQLSEACTNSNIEKRFILLQEALRKLSEPHYHTLSLLCKHLLRITVYERQNQMSAANLGIVWGPSFTWPDEGAGTRALHLCTDVNRIVQYLIEESTKLFS